MNEFYYEVRRTVERHGPPVYVQHGELVGMTGFRSVYGFDRETRDMILTRGSVRDLDGLPVYSDTLFIDFDGMEGVNVLDNALRGEGIRYEVWDTGRRGVHFHIPIAPMFGPGVPYSQLRWVREHAPGEWDGTVYRPHSVIRLPGTMHEKNPGHGKEVLWASPGKTLIIPALTPPPPTSATPGSLDGTAKPESVFWSNILVPKSSPGRTNRVYYLGALARECGVEYEAGLEAVRNWAVTWCSPPLTNEREIVRTYRSGYEG